jgi:nucleotide-binding universal stress UspA family protein
MATARQVTPRLYLNLRKIALLTDFSAGANIALKFAAIFARTYKASLVLAHAYFPPVAFVASDVTFPYEGFDDIQGSLEKRLLDLTKMPFLHDIKCTTLLSLGGPRDLLENLTDSDLIMVGTLGETGLAKAALGSVAESVFRSSNTPVLTVGPYCHCNGKGEASLRTILYATDFSSGADIALPYAILIAKDSGTELVLLHVKDDKEVPFSFNRAMASSEPLEKLQRLVPEDMDSGVKSRCIVGFGTPASTVIFEQARDVNADLIVMGARGAGAFSTVISHFGGGTAYKVAAQSECPVLTIRSPRS